MTFLDSQLQLFWYWINERHSIYLRRAAGQPQPWTKDKILQEYKFTNVYRQLDAVTQEWTKILNASKVKKPTNGDLLFRLLRFRMFNWPPTDSFLSVFMGEWKWDRAQAVKLLTVRAKTYKVFTGAYIIPTGGKGVPKVKVVCKALDYAWLRRDDFAARINANNSMQYTTDILQGFPTIGPFIAYELACDLRFTKILFAVNDVNTWANPGPGAKRGVHRLLAGDVKKPSGTIDYVYAMRCLYLMATGVNSPLNFLHDRGLWQGEWPFEMREIEHSLCEFDKYMRVKNGEGRLRSKFTPTRELHT